MYFISEHHIFLFLVQVFIILLLARVSGEIFKKFNWPSLTAELLVGIILGPTILGRFFPEISSLLFPDDIIQKNMLETIAWVGLFFLLLDTGLEIDFSSALRQKGSVLVIAFADILIPMIIAFVPTLFIGSSYLVDPSRKIEFSLFIATVMTISAIPVASRVMHDLNILKTDMGFLTISALAVNDFTGWILFTIILAIFTQSGLSYTGIFMIFFVTFLFSVIALTFGRKVSNNIVDLFQKYKFPEPASSFTFACLSGFLCGAITQKLGIHGLFGFFVAGVMVGEAKNIKENTRSIISQMVHSLFVPLFFVNIGLKIDFLKGFDFFIVLFMVLVGIFGRYIGAWLGALFVGIDKYERNLIAIAHTPGGMMEIVVALLAFEMNLITQPIFVAIVISAIFSSVIMGPWMSYSLKKMKDVNLLDYLELNNCIDILDKGEKEDILRKILLNVSEIIDINVNEMLNVFLKREREFSTGIGNNVSIPHIITDKIEKPVLSFALVKEGVEWNSPDGKDVNFVFLLISPAKNRELHLKILSKIAIKMKDDSVRSKIFESDNLRELKKNLKKLFN